MKREKELSIQDQAKRLHEMVARDLTEEQRARVESAKAGIRGVVELFKEEGQVALSLCAADFAAEPQPESTGNPVRYIAFFVTEKPLPGESYAGIPIAGRTIFIRALDVSDEEGADPLTAAEESALFGETLLNTFETGDE